MIKKGNFILMILMLLASILHAEDEYIDSAEKLAYASDLMGKSKDYISTALLIGLGLTIVGLTFKVAAIVRDINKETALIEDILGWIGGLVAAAVAFAVLWNFVDFQFIQI